jgi:tetraacyldisaccharide 4'-kinase
VFTRLAKALESSWYRPPRGTLLLLPLEWLFAALTALRRQAFAGNYLKRYRSSCPVVVVGNLTVGGTGKTPVVIALVSALRERGLRVGVVSRGFGGLLTASPQRVDRTSNPRDVGDESVLIAELTGAPVVVCRDRSAAARELAVGGEVDVIISDDGLQHYALERDFEIVTLSSERRFGNGHLLPVGPLREAPRRLATVDWVLERGGSDPFSACPLKHGNVVALDGSESLAVAALASRGPVHAVAGIGDPTGFFNLLRELGFDMQEHRFPDHHQFSRDDLAPFADRAVVMTQKDAVKCRSFGFTNHWALEVRAVLPDGLVDAVVKTVEEHRQ